MLVPLNRSDDIVQVLAYVQALASPESEIVLPRVLPGLETHDEASRGLRVPAEAVADTALAEFEVYVTDT